VIDPKGKMTQKDFGLLVGISQPAVSGLISRGVLGADDCAADWLINYCDNLRMQAAGRDGDSSGALTAERARLARAQAEKIEMQNAVQRGQLAPVSILEQVLATTGTKAQRILATIKGELRRRFPAMSATDMQAVDTIIGKALGQIASMSLSVADDDDAGIADDDQPAVVNDAEAA
jgi:phage terminase Nu1 subunit (DNA packaging protein)